MTVWTLVEDGSHGDLVIGQTRQDVIHRFGDPTAAQHHILKYDEVELHFNVDRLWLVHTEIGSAPQPTAVRSALLGLEPEEFQWPIDIARVIQRAAQLDIQVQEGERYEMRELKIGRLALLIHAEDEFAAWSVS